MSADHCLDSFTSYGSQTAFEDESPLFALATPSWQFNGSWWGPIDYLSSTPSENTNYNACPLRPCILSPSFSPSSPSLDSFSATSWFGSMSPPIASPALSAASSSRAPTFEALFSLTSLSDTWPWTTPSFKSGASISSISPSSYVSTSTVDHPNEPSCRPHTLSPPFPDDAWYDTQDELIALASPSSCLYPPSPTPLLVYSAASSPSTSPPAPSTPLSYGESSPTSWTNESTPIQSPDYLNVDREPSAFNESLGYLTTQLYTFSNQHQLAPEPNEVDLHHKEIADQKIKSALPAAGQQLCHHSEAQCTAGHTASRESNLSGFDGVFEPVEPKPNGSKDKSRAGKSRKTRLHPYPGEGRAKAQGKTRNEEADIGGDAAASFTVMEWQVVVAGHASPDASGTVRKSKLKRLDVEKECKPVNVYFKLKTLENKKREDHRRKERIGALQKEFAVPVPDTLTFVGGTKMDKGPKKRSG